MYLTSGARALGLILAIGTATMPSAPTVLGAPVRGTISVARGWQHVLVDVPAFTANEAQLVVGGPGVVAFAPGTQLVPTRLWASADGRKWRPLPSHDFGRGAVTWSIYAAGKDLVITGHSPTGSGGPGVDRIWASHDGGTTWHASPAHLRFTALAAGGDGVVAFSEADISHPIRVWTSADGLRWRQLKQPPGVFANGLVSSIARGVHGLVAGGVAVSSSTPSVTAGIWTSPDGRTWRQMPNTGRIFGNGSDGSHVIAVAAGPRGFLAIGQGPGMHQTVAWASPDGVHWRRAPVPFSEPEGTSEKLVAWQEGFSQFGDEGGDTAVWSSSDGLGWTRVGSDALFGGTARVTSAATFKGGVAAIGSFAGPPQPACLPSREAALSDLRTFHPAAFLWSPAASGRTTTPTIDRSDPRTFTLVPTDGITDDGPGAYVNLCGLDPALGRHRAYSLSFFDPGDRSYPGEVISIITQRPQAAMACFHLVGRLFGLGLGTIQHKREISPGVRIGEETRVFQLGLRFWEPPNDPFTQVGVGWRKGRVIGVVEAGTEPEAVMLAEKQLAHLERP